MFGNQDRVRTVHSSILADTHVFSPQLTNEFRVGFSRFGEPSHGTLKGKEAVDLVGLTGYPCPQCDKTNTNTDCKVTNQRMKKSLGSVRSPIFEVPFESDSYLTHGFVGGERQSETGNCVLRFWTKKAI